MSATPRTSYLQLPPTATKSIHLIILLCDTPLPQVKAKHGTYHDIFTTLFRHSIALAESEAAAANAPTKSHERYELTIESYDVVSGQYPSEEHVKAANGVLLTGSASSAYLDDPTWIPTLTTYVSKLPTISPGLKIIGICFGHQIIARAFGAHVERNQGKWEIGVRDIELTEAGRRFMGDDEKKIGLTIHQMHQDHVPGLPQGFVLVGGTPVCSNQGMIRFVSTSNKEKEEEWKEGKFDLEDVEIITFQGHPEFSPDIVQMIIDSRESTGVISKEIAEESRGYAKESDEGVRIGRRFLKLLGV